MYEEEVNSIKLREEHTVNKEEESREPAEGKSGKRVKEERGEKIATAGPITKLHSLQQYSGVWQY